MNNRWVWVTWVLVGVTCSCSSDLAPETTAPWTVGDLIVRTAPDGYHLRWTATGDDGNAGRAARYDIRYFVGDLKANWGAAQSAPSPPKPSNPGRPDSLTLSGIGEGPFQFGIKVGDERGNWSAISNLVTASIDVTPPSPITNLSVRSTFQGFYLNWTAPSDNLAGKATRYEIRYAAGNLAGNWDSSPIAPNNVIPALAGHADSASVLGIGIGPWEIGIKSVDASGNWSGLSNVITTTIPQDLTPPAAVTNLVVDLVTEQSVVLMWTASGDDGSIGQATSYDVRYSLSPITSSNFYEAPRVSWSGSAEPNGNPQLFTVPNLQTGAYYFAVRALDEAENASDMSEVAFAGTSVPVQLTFQDTTFTLSSPDWSPDGQWIAYTTNWGIYSYTTQEIYVMPAAGGASARYTWAPYGASAAAWSPDGTRFAMSTRPEDESGRTVIAVANAQPGGTYEVIGDPGLPWRNVRGARWSRDGARIAYIASTFNPPEAVGSIMHTVAASGGSSSVVLGDGTWAIGGLDWSPDGTRIVYSSNQDGASHLWLIAPEGGDPTPLSLATGGGPRWSPDGSKIAYIKDRQLWIVYAGGEHPAQVTFDTNRDVNSLTWSPDNATIAFAAYVGQFPNLWRMRVK